jgi:hypothetical protein
LDYRPTSSTDGSEVPPCLECCEYRATVSLFYPIEDRFLATLKGRKVEVVNPTKSWTLAQKYGLLL